MIKSYLTIVSFKYTESTPFTMTYALRDGYGVTAKYVGSAFKLIHVREIAIRYIRVNKRGDYVITVVEAEPKLDFTKADRIGRTWEEKKVVGYVQRKGGLYFWGTGEYEGRLGRPLHRDGQLGRNWL